MDVENESDSDSGDDGNMDRETLMKMMLSNPGLWRELLDAKKEEESQNKIDVSNKLEYLRTFCDWKRYLEKLFDMEEATDKKLLSNKLNKSNNNDNDNDNDEEKSKSSVLQSISDIPIEQISPYMLLDLLIIERRIKQRNIAIDLKSNKEKLDLLIKDGVYELKLKLYENKIRFFDPNFDKKNEKNQEMFSNAIDFSLQLYHKFLVKLNVKNNVNNKIFTKSYCVFHLLFKTAQENECNTLLSIFNELNYSFLIPNIIIDTIAQYSCVIYAKCINSGDVHFIYAALMPSKYIYQRLWYVKRAQASDSDSDSDCMEYSVDYFENIQEAGEVVHVFEPCHCDPRFVAEGKFGTMDILLYYNSIDTYCIVGSSGVELIDFELPTYLRFKSSET